jgi:TRAP-type C4-dicarboxylate transport system substrate-binding protein
MMDRVTASIAAAIVAVVVGAVSHPARADEVALIFGTGQLPGTPVATEIYHPWVAAVNAAGKGIVQIDERDGRAVLNTTNFYDRVIDDVVQIGFGSLSYVGGKFPIEAVTDLPIDATSKVASVAFWRLYKSGALDSEFKDLVPLAFVKYPPTWIHLHKIQPRLESVQGLKISPTSKQIANLLQLLGATPVSLTYQENYSALEQGTIDGICFPIAGIYSENFGNTVAEHLEMNLGSGTSMVFMTKKRFDTLPQARDVLEENSGEALTAKWGALFDRLTKESIDHFRADPKHKFVKLPTTLEAKWSDGVKSLEAAYVAKVTGSDKVLAEFRETVAQVKAEK